MVNRIRVWTGSAATVPRQLLLWAQRMLGGQSSFGFISHIYTSLLILKSQIQATNIQFSNLILIQDYTIVLQRSKKVKEALESTKLVAKTIRLDDEVRYPYQTLNKRPSIYMARFELNSRQDRRDTRLRSQINIVGYTISRATTSILILKFKV